MILATTRVADVERYLEVFAGPGAAKRAEHGCRGATVFRDAGDPNRVWAFFDWDDAGFDRFRADPDVPPMMEGAGLLEIPQVAELLRHFDA